MSAAVDLGFKPYAHQRAAHRLRVVSQDEQLSGMPPSARFMVLVWHRRAGKTVFAVIELVLAALVCAREKGRFGYVAPYRNQAKAVAWMYLTAFATRIPGAKVNEGDLSVTFPNGASVRLFGADNQDALRGLYFDGIVLDEVADMRPMVWGEIIRPALADRQGWALFIGTPKGVNLFSELYFRAQTEPGWKADLRRASDTGVIPATELEQARREMSQSQYAQEFDCDFAASADDVLLRLDDVLAAQRRVVVERDVKHAAKVLGVDCARYGSDRSCLFPRQGLAALKWKTFRDLSTMALADQVALTADRWHPDAIFVDATGVGGGVVDRLIQLNFEVVPVDFGSAPTDERFENKRAEMWWTGAEWVRTAGALPQGNELVQDLTAPKYTYRNRRGRLQLESKDDMRARGLPSPDVGDAFVLTFAAPVLPKQHMPSATVTKPLSVHDYDPYQEA